MKRWISFASHAVAVATSFVVLSVTPVVVYAAIALARGWGSGHAGDPSSVLAVPLLSALGAGAFSMGIAPVLAVWGQKISRKFGWNAAMMPLLLACAATVALSFGNGVFGWGLSSLATLGGGLALGAAFGVYWAPLRWAQRVLPNLDAQGGRLRARLEEGNPARRVSLS